MLYERPLCKTGCCLYIQEEVAWVCVKTEHVTWTWLRIILNVKLLSVHLSTHVGRTSVSILQTNFSFSLCCRDSKMAVSICPCFIYPKLPNGFPFLLEFSCLRDAYHIFSLFLYVKLESKFIGFLILFTMQKIRIRSIKRRYEIDLTSAASV